MPTILLACQTMQAEVELARQQAGTSYPVFYFASGLHNTPDELRRQLQEQINGLSSTDDVILLAFGCCGNGLTGLRAAQATLVIPRIDDCITLLLGSTKARKSIPNEISTYFLTKGWLDPGGNIMWSYTAWVEHYGEQKALRLVKKLLHHYTRFLIIDTGSYDIGEMVNSVQKFAARLNMQYGVVPGSLRLLQKLLTGPWDEEFIVLNPGQETRLQDFYPAL
ncbi:DUF1638 domain-containing protein [Sporomusa termitida]|uniref:DUF1638 domain-containing protein n=1 Tax=Sporomusa termitida TaxID=2377 RepID=A0A517DQ30_9FIRM|nr:DUF1638 domain-containing protein [Sporomusa termitida]QDR79417.1 hypothetical protein SPTER_06920 [Sporomusa termitida]